MKNSYIPISFIRIDRLGNIAILCNIPIWIAGEHSKIHLIISLVNQFYLLQIFFIFNTISYLLFVFILNNSPHRVRVKFRSIVFMYRNMPWIGLLFVFDWTIL